MDHLSNCFQTKLLRAEAAHDYKPNGCRVAAAQWWLTAAVMHCVSDQEHQCITEAVNWQRRSIGLREQPPHYTTAGRYS
jgi:hypothetical protein